MAHLKRNASVNEQLKMLGRMAYSITNNPLTVKDAIVQHFDLTAEQYRIFDAAYKKAGDDPLEV